MKSIHRMLVPITVLAAVSALSQAADPAKPWEAPDLTPVRMGTAPVHEPIVLVQDGKPVATIALMAASPGRDLTLAVDQLQRRIEAATGARLEIVKGTATAPAIVIGNCPLAAGNGLDGATMPPEGFAIRTAPGFVFIAGNRGEVDGTTWGVNDFMERFVGVRWFLPMPEGDEDLGVSVPRTPTLVVPPVSLEDAPAFRKRVIWPNTSDPWHGAGLNMGPLHTFLRAGNSWPVDLQVHTPRWQGNEAFKKERPEVYQLKADGTRDYGVLCYGNPRTLETYLEQIGNAVEGKPYSLGMRGKAITVSPADVEVCCYCEDCRRLWDKDGGTWGTASKILATFVDKLGREVKARWPDQGFTVIFLPYLNYTAAPDGFRFPDNVEVQICGMPGLASYKEPAIRDAEQANIDKWIAISGRKVQNWHYDVWPAHKTKAAYQYPHVVKDFYARNRDKTVGTFINGEFNHWPRQHISLYCWLKCLWNPDFNVDAAVDAFCTRMFGPAAATMRELVGMQIEGWENSRWPGGRFSPKGIYEESFPRAKAVRMEALFARARQEAAPDPLATKRLDYIAQPMLDFFKESKDLAEGTGFQPLIAQKVGEDPVVDGRLDDEVWKRAQPNGFVVAAGPRKGQAAAYPTAVQGVWTPNGLTLAFRMTEPTPDLLEVSHGGHDNGEVWWDDNVEIFLDVTGRNEGDFYQMIVNAEGKTYDTHMKDLAFEWTGAKSAAFRGDGFWSMEVFVPYSVFPNALVPGRATQVVWTGNFTRHRVADHGKSFEAKGGPRQGSVREYSRMNTTGSTTSDNLADFAEIRFIE